MNRLFIALTTIAILLAPTASARTVTADYDIAFQNLNGSVADPVGVTSDGVIEYGGVRFTPLVGETHVSVSVADAAGGKPAIVVCQDSDLDMVCGEVGEPRVEGCGGAEVDIASNGGQVLVFVSVQNAASASIGRLTVTPAPCGTELAAGTTGIVTAVFS